MSPADRLWQQVQRRAAFVAQDITRALVRAFAAIRDEFTPSEIEDLLASGHVDAAIDRIIEGARVDEALQPVRGAIRDGVATGMRSFARDLPPSARPATVSGAFNILNPRIIDAIRALEGRVVDRLTADVRATLKQAVEAGFTAGRTPAQVAKDLRGVIGLGPTQEQAVRNLRAELEAGQYGAASSRALIDARYNLAKLDTLSAAARAARIDTIVGAYREAYVALNTETVARTASLQAMKESQALTRADAIDRGVLDPGTQVKTWRGVMDDRERDEHVAMEGETVPWDQPFSNGQDVPGEDDYNCRCIAVFSTRAPSPF